MTQPLSSWAINKTKPNVQNIYKKFHSGFIFNSHSLEKKLFVKYEQAI